MTQILIAFSFILPLIKNYGLVYVKTLFSFSEQHNFFMNLEKDICIEGQRNHVCKLELDCLPLYNYSWN